MLTAADPAACTSPQQAVLGGVLLKVLLEFLRVEQLLAQLSCSRLLHLQAHRAHMRQQKASTDTTQITIAKFHKIDLKKLEIKRYDKRYERGAFDNKIILEEADE